MYYGIPTSFKDVCAHVQCLSVFFCVKLTMKRSFSQPSTSGESGKRSRLFSLQQALDLVYDSDEDEQDLADIYPESDLESVDSDANSESSNEDEGLDVDLDLDLSIPTPRSKSCIRCSLCQAYLCIKRGSTCWTEYHTKVEYWR